MGVSSKVRVSEIPETTVLKGGLLETPLKSGPRNPRSSWNHRIPLVTELAKPDTEPLRLHSLRPPL